MIITAVKLDYHNKAVIAVLMKVVIPIMIIDNGSESFSHDYTTLNCRHPGTKESPSEETAQKIRYKLYDEIESIMALNRSSEIRLNG